MKKIRFYKMSGSGNDFILVDNRKNAIDDQSLKQLVVSACRRKMSVGADGVILVENSREADFKWRFYNADGSRAEMCGNGARCVSRFAYLQGITGKSLSFETDAGIVTAQVAGDRVKIRMTDPGDLRMDRTVVADDKTIIYDFINTGVPHVIIPAEDIDTMDIVKIGRAIRYHEAFSPSGTNVNFYGIDGENTIAVRTYERGVEDETLACGTGSVAAALVMAVRRGWPSPVSVRTRSDAYLRIFFEWENDIFSPVHLEGDARIIYQGELWDEAWR